MELVINITEQAYNNIKDLKAVYLGRFPYKGIVTAAIRAIKDGKPLPKGHSNLIDENDLWDAYIVSGYDFYDAMDLVEKVIEADEED